ncbi:dynein associated protein-domain-containing protein [Chytridium lagenaria]|nr:dynein associated protein-domain-containing protein [Chytridium lagenaria]
MNIEVGSRVELTTPSSVSQVGIVRFVGETSFATGKWVGVELDSPTGKNDGSVQGQRYFDCKPLYGVFVRSSQVKKVLSSASKPPSAVKSPVLASTRTPRTPLAKNPLGSPTTSASTPSLSSKKPSTLSTPSLSSGRPRTTPSSKAPVVSPRGAESPLASPVVSPTQVAGLHGDTVESEPDVAEPSESPAPSAGTRENDLMFSEYRGESASGKNDEDWEPRSKESVISPMPPSPALPLPSEIQELQSELKEFRRAQLDIQSEKRIWRNKVAELNEALEMMTLDKEMAEEHISSTDTDGVNADAQVLSRQNDRLPGKAEMQIEHLSESLDNALGAEQMVEHLTDKNLELGEKLEELKSTIADLEALRDLNDELEENHILTEKELQAEIDAKTRMVQELKKRLLSQEETISDHERVMFQFRNLVRTLQSDIDDLRSSTQSSEPYSSELLNSQTQEMLSLNLRLQSTELKHRAKTIEADLKQLEASQAQEHLEIIKLFLPESFFKEEHDPILSVLLLRRLKFKCHLMKSYLKDSKSSFETVDRMSFYYELLQKLTSLHSVSGRLLALIETCAVEKFAELGYLYHELVGTERRINAVIDILKKDDMLEASFLEELNRGLVHSLSMSRKTYTPLDKSDAFVLQQASIGFCEVVLVSTDRLATELKRLEKIFGVADVDDLEVRTELEIVKAEFLKNVPRVEEVVEGVRGRARKLVKRMSEGSEPCFGAVHELIRRFCDVAGVVAKAVDYVVVLHGNVLTYCKDRLDNRLLPSVAILIKLSTNASEALLGVVEGSMGEGLVQVLDKVVPMLDECSVKMEESMGKPISPWNVRGVGEEVLGLVREVKVKEQVCEEYAVKVDLLERKVENVRKNLHAENMNVEQENVKFKKLLSRQEKFGGSPRKMQDDGVHPRSPGSGTNGMPTPLPFAFESLKGALRYVRAENARLKALKTLGMSQGLFQAQDPLLARGAPPAYDETCGVGCDKEEEGGGKGWMRVGECPGVRFGEEVERVEGLVRRVEEVKGRVGVVKGRVGVENANASGSLKAIGRVGVPRVGTFSCGEEKVKRSIVSSTYIVHIYYNTMGGWQGTRK